MSKPERILISAATPFELEALQAACSGTEYSHIEPYLHVTGVGMVNTALHLTRLLTDAHFDLAINIGIAGSFDPGIVMGDVVQVAEDRIAWFGAEDRNGFLPAEEMGLCPREEVILPATYAVKGLAKVRGITVNMAHGSAASIRRAMERYGPQVESMEGAAFFRACLHFGVPAMQVRAISNRVEPRDRNAWDIPLALNNLTAQVLQLLDRLDHGD